MADDLRHRLRSVATNTYCVNEKNPRTYDREWNLHVLWADGTTSRYVGRDEDGSEGVYRQGLADAQRRGLMPATFTSGLERPVVAPIKPCSHCGSPFCWGPKGSQA